MTIRAKFLCQSVQDFGQTETVVLNAVNGAKGTANAQWSKWTPSGSMSLSISNPDARGKFKPGGFYYLDIADAPEGDDA